MMGQTPEQQSTPPDVLNAKATEIEIDIIEGTEESVYLEGMKRIFKATPGLIEDVAPEYQARLRQKLL